VKLNADPRLPVPEWTLDYLRRLNARWYEVWRSLVTAVNERLTVQHNGARVGAQPVLNLIDGTGASLTVTEDLAEGRIDVEIAASGGSGGGTTCCAVESTSGGGTLLDNSSTQLFTGVTAVGLAQPDAPDTCTAVIVGSVTVALPSSTATDTSTVTFWLAATKPGEATAFEEWGYQTVVAPIYDDSGPLLQMAVSLNGSITIPDPDGGFGDFTYSIYASPTNENLAQVEVVNYALTAFMLPCAPPVIPT
jgi:hypothetical protein